MVMTNQRAIILLSQMYLPAFDEEEKEAITKAIEALTEQEPRVLTLEEFMAHWKLPFKERPPIWEEWKIDEGKGRWKLYGRATGGYGTLWRCWSAKPTEKQMEATPWTE